MLIEFYVFVNQLVMRFIELVSKFCTMQSISFKTLVTRHRMFMGKYGS